MTETPHELVWGDVLRVRTRVTAGRLRPTYAFEATLHRAAAEGEAAAAGVSLGSLLVVLVLAGLRALKGGHLVHGLLRG